MEMGWDDGAETGAGAALVPCRSRSRIRRRTVVVGDDGWRKKEREKELEGIWNVIDEAMAVDGKFLPLLNHYERCVLSTYRLQFLMSKLPATTLLTYSYPTALQPAQSCH